MKKWMVLLVLPVLTTAVFAGCSPSEDTESSNEDIASGTVEADEVDEEAEGDGFYGIGDRAANEDVAYTLNSVTLVDERNSVTDKNPTYVIAVEYVFENESDEPQYAGWDLSVYDSEGHKADTYPLDISGGEVAPGKKLTVVEYFGLDVLGETEFHFEPTFSFFTDPVIFLVDVTE